MFYPIFVDYLALNQNVYRPDCIRGNLARDGPVLQGPQAYLTTLTREIAIMIDHTLSFSQNRHPDYAVNVDYEKFFQAFTIRPRTQHEGGDGEQSPPMGESDGIDVHQGYGGIMDDDDEDFDVYGLVVDDKDRDEEDTESNNSNMDDGKLDGGELYDSRTGDKGLDNSGTGDGGPGNSELKYSRMGINELSDYRMGDGEASDFQMDNGELGNSGIGDGADVCTTGNADGLGMDWIRPRLITSITYKGSFPAALNPLPWRNAPKPDGSNAEFNENLTYCRNYLHGFAMHTPYYLLNLKSKDIRPQDARGVTVAGVGKGAAMGKNTNGGKKQKRKASEVAKGLVSSKWLSLQFSLMLHLVSRSGFGASSNKGTSGITKEKNSVW